MKFELRESGLFRDYGDLSETALAECRLRVLDSIIGTLAGGVMSDQEALAAIGRPARGGKGWRTLLPGHRYDDLESAAMINSILLRETDWMDSYRREGVVQSGHPGDQMAVLLALCNDQHMTGTRLIELTHLAYQLWRAWSDAMPNITGDGWDHVSKLALTVPMLAAAYDDADATQLNNAVALSACNGPVLFGVRRGQISSWKSGLSGYAVARALWCYRLSGWYGLGGEILDDMPGGWSRAVTPTASSISGCDPDEVFRHMEIKEYPCYQYGQAAVACGGTLSDELSGNLRAIESLTIAIPARDLPQVRSLLHSPRPLEASSADHNISYGTAIALKHGQLGPGHYRREHLDDPDVLRLIDLARIEAVPDSDADVAAQVTVTVDGRTLEQARSTAESGAGALGAAKRVEYRRSVVTRKARMLAELAPVDVLALIDATDQLETFGGPELIGLVADAGKGLRSPGPQRIVEDR